MATVIEFPAKDGNSILVAVTTAPVGAVTTRGLPMHGVIERTERSFESSLTAIRTVADGVLAQMTDLARHPAEVKVDFGLEITAESGAILVGASGSAHLRVELTWRPTPHENDREADRESALDGVR